MSTVQRVNFDPVTSTMYANIRDVPLADKTLIQPNNSATGLVDGEWMTFNTSGKLVRATDVTSLGAVASGLAWILWYERGRSDGQAKAEPSVPILYLTEYEGDTRIFDAAVTVTGGAPITAIGQPLKVATIALGGRNYSGLVGSQLTENVPIIGYVTKLPSQNGGRLRFLRTAAIKNG